MTLYNRFFYVNYLFRCFPLLPLWGMGKSLLPSQRRLWRVRGQVLKPWRATGMFGLISNRVWTALISTWWKINNHDCNGITLSVHMLATWGGCCRLPVADSDFTQSSGNKCCKAFGSRAQRTTGKKCNAAREHTYWNQESIVNHIVRNIMVTCQFDRSRFCSNAVAWQFDLAASLPEVPQGALCCMPGEPCTPSIVIFYIYPSSNI